MIRGYFGGYPGRLRPFVIANVTIPSLGLVGIVHFLVDTGADSTLLAPRDALALGLELRGLPQATPSTGVGGRTPTVIRNLTAESLARYIKRMYADLLSLAAHSALLEDRRWELGVRVRVGVMAHDR